MGSVQKKTVSGWPYMINYVVLHTFGIPLNQHRHTHRYIHIFIPSNIYIEKWIKYRKANISLGKLVLEVM